MNRHRPNSPDPRKQHTRSPSPTLQPTKAVPPPPRAGKHTSPTPEPHGRHAAAFPARLGQVRRRRKARHTRTSPPPPPARLGEVAPRRPGGSSGSRAAAGPLPGSVRLGPQPPRRSPRGPPPPGIYLRGAAAGSGLGPARASARQRRHIPPPAAAGDALETQEGRRERGKVRARVDWLGAPPPAPPTAAAERRVAGRAAAGAADATGNECTLAPRLSGGRTSFGLEHPERPGTRK